ncbi:hypothetical protein [Catenulispora pinistramenti]|uniref:hypothetical protein n=1 Tax=Catenulispora pinistramenti TaxID=2705254 RepID=UPI001E5F45E2|nr:hypothetical protein [Catenulispora pinistramenti]
MPNSRRLARIVFAGAIAASAALPAATVAKAATAAGTPPPLAWQQCDYAPGYQCANLTVPLDYAHPAGPTIQVALIRHLASAAVCPTRTSPPC